MAPTATTGITRSRAAEAVTAGMGAHGAHGGHGRGAAKQALLVAVVLTASFMVVEAVVGYWSGSLALLADAGHMLADAGALGLALFAQVVASKPRTERQTFGYRRAEVLAAFVNGMALAAVAVLVFKEALERYLAPVPIRGGAMLTTAVVGLGINGLVALTLARSQKESMNVRAAFAHVLSDALGSVAADPRGARGGVPGLAARRSHSLFLDCAARRVRRLARAQGDDRHAARGGSPHLDVVAIEKTILDCEGVAEAHDLHVWRISEHFDALTAHVTLTRGSHGTDVCRTVADRLREDHGLLHVTIQPEAPPPNELVTVRASRDGQPLTRAK